MRDPGRSHDWLSVKMVNGTVVDAWLHFQVMSIANWMSPTELESAHPRVMG